MAPLTEEHKAKREMQLPPLAITQNKVRAYMKTADMPLKQFAALVGYSAPGIKKLLSGRYSHVAGSDLLIRQACELAMERHPVGVRSTTSQGELYETENVREMRRWFEHCHQHQALAFVYGPPGSQKTFVLQHLVAEFNRREMRIEDSRNRAYLVRASINIRPRDMMAKICTETGAYVGATMQSCMNGLRQQLKGTKTVIVLDEAQLCGIPALEALRELHDMEPRVGILLAGSHGLKNFFDQRASELEQWNSRLHAGVALSGVSDKCAREIVKAECPGLSPDQINTLIEGSRVQDIYSRDRSRTYISMRRLFNTFGELRQLASNAKEA